MKTENKLKMYLEAFKLKKDNAICESCFVKTLKIVLNSIKLEKEREFK